MLAHPFIHPQFDPVAFSLGFLHVRWYGLMYLVAFLLFIFLGKYRARKNVWQEWKPVELDDLMFYGMLGVIFGGRLGYVLFYKADFYLAHPLDIIKVWEGGMSFHGGMLGTLCALWYYAHKTGRHFLQVGDFVAPLVPAGLAFGRLGNFINGELWGRVTSPDAPWAMLFPQAWQADAKLLADNPSLRDVAVQHFDTYSQQLITNLPRHPSQLYELSLEGITLFVILWLFTRKSRPMGAASGLFLTGYGCFRFIVEFTREPDDFLGLLAAHMSMGQWLSLPMVLAGLGMMVWAYRRKPA